MKRTLYAVLTVSLLASAVLVVAEDAPKFKTERERASYAIGVEMGNNFKRQGVDIDAALLAQGLKDALAGAPLLLTEAEAREAVMALQKDMMAKQQALQQVKGEKAKAEGEAFLAANKAKAGVITLPSGLQYRVVTEGSGATPKGTDTVTVNYRGTLVDGTEFDSSYKRGQPATFQVNGVIAGWTEALQLMKVGSKWELFIPAGLAYGEHGRGGTIPPNAVLVFELELLAVK